MSSPSRMMASNLAKLAAITVSFREAGSEVSKAVRQPRSILAVL